MTANSRMPFVPVADAAMTLPASMYRDAAFYARERPAVFARARDGAVNAGRWLFRWPNLALNLYPNAMVVERMLPTGALSTRIEYSYFFSDPDDPANDDVVRISKTVIEQDREIVEAVQRNLDAGVYERGRLSPRHEAGVAQFQRLVRAALDRPVPEYS
jgi:choline monooxygenase